MLGLVLRSIRFFLLQKGQGKAALAGTARAACSNLIDFFNDLSPFEFNVYVGDREIRFLFSGILTISGCCSRFDAAVPVRLTVAENAGRMHGDGGESVCLGCEKQHRRAKKCQEVARCVDEARCRVPGPACAGIYTTRKRKSCANAEASRAGELWRSGNT
ncbi:hypothetical protein HG535_0C01590 [Zygotorulaspora mrakii]|uniref:Uncharacterized protein n=1 Tax=Zygotorulaspora mrakii TaxID=42260 RepID=A0A7H9AZM1_ZYGMR|nr:uncharacterized protein HG535_0C01590 [Zygotorulaspora mrakii]QLG71810.1 hypothetical protein HG535_0C01590 [Zygotorulaspora mrakii]